MKLRYVAALDGLRGYAVISVILFHCHLIYWGWLGVQLFFTLSGFLITLGLLSSQEKPFKKYLWDFYMRRALRIFPLYFAFLLALSYSFEQIAIKRDWPYLFSYTHNFLRTSSNYTHSEFYGHLWSLSVEEQFYVVWPLVLFFLPNRFFKSAVVLLIAFLFVAKMTLFALSELGFVDRETIVGLIYFHTIFQADAFMFGALAAYLYRNRVVINPYLGLASLVLIALVGAAIELSNGANLIAALRLLAMPAMFKSQGLGFAFTLFAAAFMLCTLAAAQQQRGLLRLLLENRYIVYTGKISYGLYVFHYPIIHTAEALVDLGNPVRKLTAYFVAITISFLIAALSYRFFESKLLALKSRYA